MEILFGPSGLGETYYFIKKFVTFKSLKIFFLNREYSEEQNIYWDNNLILRIVMLWCVNRHDY